MLTSATCRGTAGLFAQEKEENKRCDREQGADDGDEGHAGGAVPLYT